MTAAVVLNPVRYHQVPPGTSAIRKLPYVLVNEAGGA